MTHTLIQPINQFQDRWHEPIKIPSSTSQSKFSARLSKAENATRQVDLCVCIREKAPQACSLSHPSLGIRRQQPKCASSVTTGQARYLSNNLRLSRLIVTYNATILKSNATMASGSGVSNAAPWPSLLVPSSDSLRLRSPAGILCRKACWFWDGSRLLKWLPRHPKSDSPCWSKGTGERGKLSLSILHIKLFSKYISYRYTSE